MKIITDQLNGFMKGRQSFTFLLCVLATYMFVILPFLDEGFLSRLLFMMFYFLFLSSGINFLDKRKKTIIVLLLIVAPFGILVFDIFFNLPWLTLAVDLFIIFYCVWLGSIILTRTFSKGHITSNRVLGAIIVYLLSGFVFAMIYHIIYLLRGHNAFNGLITFQRTEFMYFSITTLTTLGYGDITPVNVFARSLSNLEALNGQLYPAILIARLVSMEFATTRSK
ncbi:MAG TPA: ion channel [Puia sp.]|nr:ion channel [Puia sp.]